MTKPFDILCLAAMALAVLFCGGCSLDKGIEEATRILGVMNEEAPLIRPRKMTAEDMIKTPLEKFTNSVGMEFVHIPAGRFTMGSALQELQSLPNEAPHEVTFTRGFFMQATEVTQKQWADVVGNRPSHFADCGDDCPVENISWNDAFAFIRRLNEKEKTSRYRMPFEAEWEYACRAGTRTPFAFGKCLSTENANYDGRYPLQQDFTAIVNEKDMKRENIYRCEKGKNRGKTLPVASLAPNAWGLYDMHGNVFEYCQDLYALYLEGPQTDPKGPAMGQGRVVRGGGWSSDARYCRSAARRSVDQESANYLRGFRVVMEEK